MEIRGRKREKARGIGEKRGKEEKRAQGKQALGKVSQRKIQRRGTKAGKKTKLIMRGKVYRVLGVHQVGE
jgi:hypothetical protein